MIRSTQNQRRVLACATPIIAIIFAIALRDRLDHRAHIGATSQGRSAGEVLDAAARLSASEPSLAHALSNHGDAREGFTLEGARVVSAGERALRTAPATSLGLDAPALATGVFDARLGGSATRRVGFRLVGALAAHRTVSRGKLVYADAHPSTDVIVRSSAGAVQLLYLLGDASAPRMFRWALEDTTATVEARAGASRSLELLDAKGAVHARLPAGVAFDAAGKRFDVIPTWDAPSRVVAWRVDGEPTAYPVLVDPVIESARWTQVSATPPGREGGVMAYDSGRERVVLFGGSAGNDTWEWDGTTWREVTPDLPGPTSASAMAYDIARQRTVLLAVGGTWEWDGSLWSERVGEEEGPPARADATLIYDAARQRMVMFGGWYGSTVYDDTWFWDGTSWTQHDIAAFKPPARFKHAMAYDAGRQRAVLYGGMDAGSSPLGDTWEWIGTGWNNRTAGAGTPPKLSDHALVYDQNRQRVLMFGGYGDASPLTLWSWDGATWSGTTPAPSPSPRVGSSMVFDVARANVVLFGGQVISAGASSPKSAETWTLDLQGWQDVSVLAPSPRRRLGHAMVFDAARQEIVLFGGTTHAAGNTVTTDQTWVWNGSMWADRTPASGNPPARLDHALAYDAARQRVVLFGGNAGGAVPDTWTWDGIAWAQATPVGDVPDARTQHELAYDAAREQVVLFGGYVGGVRNAETWVWNGSAWSDVTPIVGNPQARAEHALVYDEARQRVVLFGGNGNGGVLGDTWTWDGSGWTNVTPAEGPLARDTHAMTYDSGAGRVVLFTPINFSLAETWTWDGAAWTELSAFIRPKSRTSAALAYDAARAQTVLYGGNGVDEGTWTLELGLGRSSTCDTDAACLTGHCVDGVCCDTACGGGAPDDCQACSVAAGAEVDGVCGAVLADAAYVCRASANACDVAEVCGGASLTCPDDAALDIEGCIDSGAVRARPRTSYCATSYGPGSSSVLFVTLLVGFAVWSRRRRSVRGGAVMFLALLSWGTLATPAFAQQGTDQAAGYETVIHDAIEAFSAARYDDARRLFRRAHELNPNARTLRGIGMSSFELSDFVASYVALTAALDDTRRPLTSEMRTQAMALRTRASAQVARLEVAVDPADAVVTVDGLAPTIVDGVVILNPGLHNVTARADGFADQTETVHVEAGSASRLRLTLTRTAEPVAAGVAVPVEPIEHGAPPVYRPLGIALAAGGGAVGLGGFVVGAVMLRNQRDRLEPHCGVSGLPDDVCTNDPVVADVADRSRGARVLGLTSLSIGLGVAATGATLLVLSLRGDSEPEMASVLPTFACTSTACVAGVVGGF